MDSPSGTAVGQTFQIIVDVYDSQDNAIDYTSQVTYDRDDRQWIRKENIAVKHAREVAVNPVTGEKSQDTSKGNTKRINRKR